MLCKKMSSFFFRMGTCLRSASALNLSTLNWERSKRFFTSSEYL